MYRSNTKTKQHAEIKKELKKKNKKSYCFLLTLLLYYIMLYFIYKIKKEGYKMKKRLFNKIMNQLKEARKNGEREEVKRLLIQAKQIKKYI